jgi:8-oxo-dGTP diphosphatase
VHWRFPVAVHVFVVREDEILLLRRLNTGYEDGRLSVVAGHVEPGETVTQAAIREGHEEVGLEFSRDRLRVVGVMHRRSEDERIDFFLSYRLGDKEPRNVEPHECSELIWTKRSELPSDTILYVRVAITTFPDDGWFREFGWEHGAPETAA